MSKRKKAPELSSYDRKIQLTIMALSIWNLEEAMYKLGLIPAGMGWSHKLGEPK